MFYRGIEIEKEPVLHEYIDDKEYKYVKQNGVKYYKENDNTWFTILNGEKIKNFTFSGNDTYNDAAYNYYKEAALFKERIKSYGLTELKEEDVIEVSNITDENEYIDLEMTIYLGLGKMDKIMYQILKKVHLILTNIEWLL